MSAAQYRIVSPAVGEIENGSADVAVTDGALTVAPSAGSTLRVPSGRISSVTEPEPFIVLVTLADGTEIELTRLGVMRTQLLAELRDARAEVAAEATAAMGDAAVFSGTVAGDSAEIRVYEDALIVTTAAATERISFSFAGAVTVRDYTVTIEVAGRAAVSLARLGRRTGELSELLAARLAQARGRTSAFLGSLLPGLDPMELRAAAGLLRDGVAVPAAALDAIHPELSSAVLGVATLPDRRDAVTWLRGHAELAIGFKQVTSVLRPAVGVTPWHDHAVAPHIGQHESPGGRFGPGLGGVLTAGMISAMGPGGGYGGYGGYGFADGFGGYWAFRALGAGLGGGMPRPMAQRPDVTRGRLTPATEDLAALTATGDDPTVLAFVLGHRSGLVVYEVLNQREPMTYAYRPDGAGDGASDGLAAVNRALDDAGFQPAALSRWLAGRVPHDDHWTAGLTALLSTGHMPD